MAEINLLAKYPQSKRDVDARAGQKTEEVRQVARRFGREFFDGDRLYGYGGFSYHPRFWEEVVKDMRDHYGLNAHSRVLDVGCAKGFMLYDLGRLVPGIHLEGLDISEYAIFHAKKEIRNCLRVGNARDLPYTDKTFDLVVSINTVHNLEREECKQALREIQRVTKKDAFITVDAYRNEEEKERMMKWNLTARTILSVEGWKKLFEEAGYTGDYYWFIP